MKIHTTYEHWICIIIIIINSFKPSDGELFVQPAVKKCKAEFCIYVFRTILGVNSDYFIKQR
jgi:hypothetical protein